MSPTGFALDNLDRALTSLNRVDVTGAPALVFDVAILDTQFCQMGLDVSTHMRTTKTQVDRAMVLFVAGVLGVLWIIRPHVLDIDGNFVGLAGWVCFSGACAWIRGEELRPGRSRAHRC